MKPAPVNFCQVCGHAMSDQMAYGKNRRVCPHCGFVHFVDPKVAAVAFVEQEGRVLLVRRAVEPERGKWALPAGYVDYGEEPGAAAVREVLEETGVTIEITGLLAVLGGPDQYGPSIVIIYRGQVVRGQPEPRDDIDALQWLKPSDPTPDLAFDSTRLMLQQWRDGLWRG